MEKLIKFFTENWEVVTGAFLALYTLVVRVYPTSRNWCVFSFLYKIIDYIPNIKKGGGLYALVFMLVLCGSVSAQNNGTFKGVFSYNTTDTTAIHNNRTSLQTSYGNAGLVYFDKTRNKWRIWAGTCPLCIVDSAYVDLLSPQGPPVEDSTINLINGLTKTGATGRLGGALTQNTSITAGAGPYNFTLSASNVGISTSGNSKLLEINSSGTGSDIAIGANDALNLASTAGSITGTAGNDVSFTATDDISIATGAGTNHDITMLSQGGSTAMTSGTGFGVTSGTGFSLTAGTTASFSSTGDMTFLTSSDQFIFQDVTLDSVTLFLQDVAGWISSPTKIGIISPEITNISEGSGAHVLTAQNNNNYLIECVGSTGGAFSNIQAVVTGQFTINGGDGTATNGGEIAYDPGTNDISLVTTGLTGNINYVSDAGNIFSSTNTSTALLQSGTGDSFAMRNGATGSTITLQTSDNDIILQGSSNADIQIIPAGTGDLSLSLNSGGGRYLIPTGLPTTDPSVTNAVWNNNSILQYSGTALNGTWTPTLTNTTNIDASTVVGLWYYVRIGTIVSFSGSLTIDATTNGVPSELQFTLPTGATSNFSLSTDAAGTMSCSTPTGSGSIASNSTTDRVVLNFTSVSTASVAYGISGHYIIK